MAKKRKTKKAKKPMSVGMKKFIGFTVAFLVTLGVGFGTGFAVSDKLNKQIDETKIESPLESGEGSSELPDSSETPETSDEA